MWRVEAKDKHHSLTLWHKSSAIRWFNILVRDWKLEAILIEVKKH